MYWIDVKPGNEQAPDGVVVKIISPGGEERKLKRQGNLWFLPDGSMYVYFTPVKWRRLEAGE